MAWTEIVRRHFSNVPVLHNEPISLPIRQFVVLWQAQEIGAPEVAKECHGRKEAVTHMDRVATSIVNTGSSQYIGVKETCFVKNVEKKNCQSSVVVTFPRILKTTAV